MHDRRPIVSTIALLLFIPLSTWATTNIDCGDDKLNQKQQTLVQSLSKKVAQLIPEVPAGWQLTKNELVIHSESYCSATPRLTHSWYIEDPQALLSSLNKMQTQVTKSAQLTAEENQRLSKLLKKNFELMKPYVSALENQDLEKARSHQTEIVKIRQRMDKIYTAADHRMLEKTETYLPKDSRLSMQIIVNERYVLLKEAEQIRLRDWHQIYQLNDGKRVGISDWQEPTTVALFGQWLAHKSNQDTALVNKIGVANNGGLNNIIISIRADQKRATDMLSQMDITPLNTLLP